MITYCTHLFQRQEKLLSVFLHGKQKRFEQPVPLYTIVLLKTGMTALAAFLQDTYDTASKI